MTTSAQLKILLDQSNGMYFFDDKDNKKVVDQIDKYLKTHDKALHKELLVGSDKGLKVGRNYPPGDEAQQADRMQRLSGRLVEMVEAAENGKKGEAAGLAGAVFKSARFADGSGIGKTLSREQVEAKLYAAHAPQHDPAADARALVESPMLARHPGKIAGALPQAQLEAVSAHNLAALREELRQSQAKFATPPLSAYKTAIETASADLNRRYDGAVVTHATNGGIQGHILPTSDRRAIQDFASDLTGNVSKAGKVSHTAVTNTQHLDTHGFVFFNVYPQTGDALKREMLSATRYLRETPEVASSALSAKAESYSFKLGALPGGSDRLTVMTLRDPVYPAGGTTAEEARKRMEGGGFATYVGDVPATGQARRKFGEVEDNYSTPMRTFAGRDTVEALKINVQLGMYKTFEGLHAQDAKNGVVDPAASKALQFYNQVQGITAPQTDKESAADCQLRQDRAAVAVAKLYQYPQLMVSGPVAVRDAERFTPTQGLTQAPAVAAVATTTTTAQTADQQQDQAVGGRHR